MKFLLLSWVAASTVLVLFAATASAQSVWDVPPPHVLFTPQSYHVATNESFSLTSYDFDYSHVVATVSYAECTCRNGRRTCNQERQGIFSQSRGMSRRGRPTVLSVQMPTVRELVGRDYFVNVTSPDGSMEYMGRRQLRFFGNDFGFLFVKTDKPIYRPEQEVNFCLAFLDKTLKPHKDSNQAEVTIYDSKFKQIMKWDSVRIPFADMACLSLPLSEEPNFGTWRIAATIKLPREPGTGDCRASHSPPRASCTFKVDEFVLPKFEVTLTGPEQLERDDNFIEAVVEAKYTFGENVAGRVKVNATLMSSQRGESLVFHEQTASLVNGRYSIRIPANSYRNAVRYRYDPFCVRSSVKLVAEVEESGRGTKIADSHTFRLVYSSVDLKFADDNPRVFRPGMNYSMRALAQLADGSVASGVPVKVKVTINNDVTTLFEDELLSEEEEGAISLDIAVPAHAKCMKISLRPSSSLTSCQEEFECFSPSPLYSPTGSYLKLTDVSRRDPQPFSRVSISAKSTVPFQTLHLLVISQGSVQHHAYGFQRNGTMSTVVSFHATHEMVPRVKVLGVFAREDGELVADLIEVDVQCSFRHRVTTYFNETHAEPGDPVSLTATATPGSIVLLSVYDKSLSLLAEACKSFEKDNVCSLLRQLTGGSSFGGESCNSDAQVSCCPGQCSEPTAYGVSNFFSAAGVRLSSNMFQPRPPVKVNPIPPYLPLLPGGEEFLVFDRLRPDDNIVAPPTQSTPEEPIVAEEDVRTFFPESWIFRLMRADRSGFVNLLTEVPDTLTTWYSEAYGLHSTTGLGIALRSQLTVVKPFFVSLELPFSVNFGEAVTITPLVFNFDRRMPKTTATVAITLHDDLDLLESTLPDNNQLVIEAGGSKAFSMKLRPRAIGRLEITISAINNQKQSDAVRKTLFVKPGCEKFEITQNIYAEGTGSHCFNYSLPSCVIPGSGSAVISATGDIMSPPNLDRLLVLPTGCGEQNLVRLATNWVVADYLVTTEQLSNFIAVKIKNNIQIGYQRQLNYLKSSGCFSIWPRAKCSSWLTAAVVNVFSGIVNFYAEEEPDMEFIDMSVIDGGLTYILGKQSKTGEFPVTGPVHNYELLRERNNVAHTAFTVAAMKEYVDTFGERGTAATNVANARRAIRKASDYMTGLFDESEELCSYALALSTFSLLRSPSASPSPTITQMVAELKTRIVNSKDYPGACFVCNTCPSDRPASSSNTGAADECAGRPSGEGSAACVETTAYALLALLEAEDTTSTVCLAQWLVRIRSGTGGFYSSQDTVIAMQALSRFSEVTFTSQLNKTVTFDIQDLTADPLTITDKTRFERKEYQVPNVPSNLNCINWSGEGTAIVQSTLTYHGCNCCNDTRAFSLELAVKKTESPVGAQLDLSMRLRYLLGRSSNMAIVDVEIPSGYIYTGWKYANDFAANAEVERVEKRGANVIFYFQSVPNTHSVIVVEFLSRYSIENPQQSPVTLYDYYDPGQTITKFYLPVTSDLLPPVVSP